MGRRFLVSFALLVVATSLVHAEPPHASYIFPAGGQRGTKVQARVGGHFLHERANFELLGAGVAAPAEIHRTETIWFEGPLIRQPASQQSEDYPQDYAAEVAIAAESPLGMRWWRCWNAQGVTPPLPFIVGDLPEVVEAETDGEPIPVAVTLPVTINGRIFPREDTDVWTFEAVAGQPISCAATSRELGSPLVAKLSVHDPYGKLLAESTGGAAAEAKLQFIAASSGPHSIHITDVASGGLQHYVYRLTVAADRPASTPPANSAAVAEAEPNETAAIAKTVTMPAVIGGRIQSPGDVDGWLIELKKGESLALTSRCGELNSPLALMLTVKDAAGKQLAQLDASSLAKNAEATLAFSTPADGTYLIEVSERFARRGGREFVYEIAVGPSADDFRLYAHDSVAVDVGTDKKLDVQIERVGTWKAPLTLHVAGLPAGVMCDDVTAQPNANKASLTFKCGKETPVVSSLIKIVGRAEIAGQVVERTALVAGPKDGFGRGADVPTRLATTLATPFKFGGQFSLTYTPRGGVLRKRYTLDRGGFEGPLEARLADRQGRHLQGVTGPVLTLPPGTTEFEYPLQLPPWMDLGRTSRTNLMLTGELKDAVGTVHKICFTTKEQNEQLIALVTASALRLSLARSTVAIQPESELEIPIAIKRDASVASKVKLELIVPPHMQGISAAAVIASPEATVATLKIKLGAEPGPLNMPLVIRASGQRQGELITAEEPIELIRLK